MALRQAEEVKDLLLQLHPGLEVELVKIRTTGDKITEAPLARIGSKGIFVKEIEEALLRGEIDLVINIPVENAPKELKDALEDEYTIRRLAVEFNVPVVTTIELATALIQVLKHQLNNQVSIRSLNEYMESLPWKHW